MIVIVDYMMGNVGSIVNMLKKVGFSAIVSSSPEVIAKAEKLILPGVGAFDSGMANIAALDLLPVLNERVLKHRIPILGICLGMQLLTERSEEGRLPGLGWIEGETIRFNFSEKQSSLKIPHMGWNTVMIRRGDTLFKHLEEDEDTAFYFVHSYHVVCRKEEDVLAETRYGYEFVCAVEKENILGTQFHPEKSHRFGMKILKNFAELT